MAAPQGRIKHGAAPPRREREARRQGALDRHAAWVQESQDAKDKLWAQVWLSADTCAPSRPAPVSALNRSSPNSPPTSENDDGTMEITPFAPR
ncbi:hypothetical protein [Streptomyces lutosisoli]|uniref:Uncharacterized protein n=1 Tax=Streptomyces lutosisoli TaxID=2665721 RepID=A0ABW2VZ12_9ACTN